MASWRLSLSGDRWKPVSSLTRRSSICVISVNQLTHPDPSLY